ncbi:MAG: class I SAM-dependent methyltransferase [Gammaproteobacteria bacterium]
MYASLHYDIAHIDADEQGFLHHHFKSARRFTLTAEALGFPWDPSGVGNILFPMPAKAFASIRVGRSLRLFSNHWGSCLLRSLLKSVHPGGELFLPITNHAEAQKKGYWSTELLREKFGAVHLHDNHPSYASVSAESTPPSAPSSLDWFLSAVTWVSIERYSWPDRQVVRATDDSFDLFNDFLLPTDWVDSQSRLAATTLKDAFLEQVYYCWGISYKSAIIRAIIHQYLASRNRLALCDVGGGYGLLCAEMLLDHSTGIQQAVCCDVEPFNLYIGNSLYRYFETELKDRLRYALSPAEEYPFPERYDIISFVGSLLYVPRERRARTLQQAWKSLNPGGLLIVHENIKSQQYQRDFDIMFESQELDELLAPFGDIKYYLSTATVEIPASSAGIRTLFRVIQRGD